MLIAVWLFGDLFHIPLATQALSILWLCHPWSLRVLCWILCGQLTSGERGLAQRNTEGILCGPFHCAQSQGMTDVATESPAWATAHVFVYSDSAVKILVSKRQR